MLQTSGLPDDALLRARPVVEQMRTELMAGQYLDVLEQVHAAGSLERALRVARFKTAKYTVERPLHLGAALAGGTPEVLAAYTAYGIPVGEAFQLRDDVLGVFGDPGQTGKPAGDDLREGKRTALVALAVERGDDAERATVERLLGDPGLDEDGVAALREVIRGTGALDVVEGLIAERVEAALGALARAELADGTPHVLHDLAVAATVRAV
jgi:geranylgeranyl diphosphate synthase type I